MRLLLFLLAIVVLILIVIVTQQRRLIYFPFRTAPDLRGASLPGASVVEFRTEDGLVLAGWFVPARATAVATVLVTNGNAGNRLFRAPLAAALAERGLAVLLFDYRGYGENAGTPTEDGLRRDALAARAFLLTRSDVQGNRLVYFGESLGAAVAADLALSHPPAALILRSPFSSLAAAGAYHYPFLPVRWILRDRYATIERIGGLQAPLLVIAGENDEIIPASQSVEVYERAPQPKSLLIIENARHNDAALNSSDRIAAAILEFLETTTNHQPPTIQPPTIQPPTIQPGHARPIHRRPGSRQDIYTSPLFARQGR